MPNVFEPNDVYILPDLLNDDNLKELAETTLTSEQLIPEVTEEVSQPTPSHPESGTMNPENQSKDLNAPQSSNSESRLPSYLIKIYPFEKGRL